MGFVNKYPYVDFHELNADALIAKVDDASAEAKAAADTVATYNDRLTTVEGDLAPIKAAMPGLASDVSDLRHDVGIMDSLITNTINPGLSTLQNEVETPSTGLLDRVTALENQPQAGGVTEYLRFGTGGTPIDYDPRITYTYLDGLIATQASADKTVNIVLVEDDELGTTWYYTLNEGEYQISAGTPRGQFTFVCRKPVLDGNNVVTGYKTCTVTVNKNVATPTYTEVQEDILPTVTSADAGDVLTVDGNGEWVAATPASGVTYSTTEHVIGKWIDDSDIYEKTFHVGSLPNNTTAQIVHDIANIGRVIEISGAGYSNNGVSIGIPYVNTSVQNQLACYVDGVYLYLNTAGDLSQYDGYVTIKYLKTV